MIAVLCIPNLQYHLYRSIEAAEDIAIAYCLVNKGG